MSEKLSVSSRTTQALRRFVPLLASLGMAGGAVAADAAPAMPLHVVHAPGVEQGGSMVHTNPKQRALDAASLLLAQRYNCGVVDVKDFHAATDVTHSNPTGTDHLNVTLSLTPNPKAAEAVKQYKDDNRIIWNPPTGLGFI